MVGSVLEPPEVKLTEPCALRKPLATAITLYVPAGAVRLNVPSRLAVTVSASVSSKLYKFTVTGLLASTCPVSWPTGRGVGDTSGVDVNVGVADTSGVEVKLGSAVEVAVADPSGGCGAGTVAGPSRVGGG